MHRLGYEKLKPHPLFLLLDFTLFYFAFIIIIIIYGLEDFFPLYLKGISLGILEVFST